MVRMSPRDHLVGTFVQICGAGVAVAELVLDLLTWHFVLEEVRGGGGPQGMAGEGALGQAGGLEASLDDAQEVVAGDRPVGQRALT
jgi:hypothetical protein